MKKLSLLVATFASFTLSAATASAQEVTLASCGTVNTGDNLNRQFYFPNFPGSNLAKVTVGLSSGSAGSYTFTLTAREGAFDGPVIGTAEQTVTLGGGTVQVIYDFAGAPVKPGTTIVFKTTMTHDAGGTPTVSQATGTAPCPLVETNGSTPPLDTFRRDSFGAIVTTLAPTITNLNPGSGPIDGGTSVTVTGTNLVPTSTVFFDDAGVALGSVVDGGGSGVVTTPPHAAGLAAVTMLVDYANDGGVDASTVINYSGGFTYDPPPVDSGIPDVNIPESGSKLDASTTTDSGTGGGTDAGTAPPAGGEEDDGCSCGVPGSRNTTNGLVIAGTAIAALALLRRRRR